MPLPGSVPVVHLFEWNKSIVHQAERFERGAVAAEHMLPVFLRIQADILETEEKMFSSQGRRGGGMWKPLADSTVARKGHSTILVETGALKHSLTIPGAPHQILRVDNEGIIFGTTRPWAFVHQYGSRRVPQREFLRFSAVDNIRWQDMLMRHLMRPFSRHAS
jgi:phage gpG-like protein